LLASKNLSRVVEAPDIKISPSKKPNALRELEIISVAV
jgi:hypothetical protein